MNKNHARENEGAKKYTHIAVPLLSSETSGCRVLFFGAGFILGILLLSDIVTSALVVWCDPFLSFVFATKSPVPLEVI